MAETVPTASIVFMAISCAIAFAIPIALLVYFRRKKGADVFPFFVGCAVMLLFALFLEAQVHSIVLSSGIGAAIRGNIWLYALYGGAIAGLFEETGRFIAFKTILKSRQGRDANALMYGAGHGGLEAAALLGLTMIANLSFSFMINTDNTAALTESLSSAELAQFDAVYQGLLAAPSYQFLIGSVERIFAVAIQISLSVLVWFAAKKQGKGYLYPLAILIHLAVDAVAALLSGMGMPVLLTEAVVGVMAVLSVVYARRVWVAEAEPA